MWPHGAQLPLLAPAALLSLTPGDDMQDHCDAVADYAPLQLHLLAHLYASDNNSAGSLAAAATLDGWPHLDFIGTAAYSAEWSASCWPGPSPPSAASCSLATCHHSFNLHLFVCSCVSLFVHSLTHLFVRSYVCSLILSSNHSHTLLIHPFINRFTCLSVRVTSLG